MIEVLQKSTHQLRQVQAESDLRLQSLQTLEEIAHWQLMWRYQDLIEEVDRYRLVKAGFALREFKYDHDPDGDWDNI